MKAPARTLASIAAILAFQPAHAVLLGSFYTIPGDPFFAAAVTDFSQGPGPDAAFSDPNNALGAPDVNTSNGLSCFLSPSTSSCLFASLGNGGSLTLQLASLFNGSSDTGTADGIYDLFVVEVGVAEATGVEISSNGTDWFSVGDIASGGGDSVGVYTYGFDLDAVGFTRSDMFGFVRLTDVLTDVDTSPEGADIDAVAGITTVVPGPATLPLAMTAVGSLVLRRWLRKR